MIVPVLAQLRVVAGCVRLRVSVIRWLVPFAVLIFSCLASPGEEMTWEFSVQISATVQTNPPTILLSWPQDQATLPDSYTIRRKDPEALSWGEEIILPGESTNYLDETVKVGTAYEYQVYKSTSNHVGYGYITAGSHVPAVENRGKLILLIEASIAGPLRSELQRLEQDLAGDGWGVLRHDVSREASVPSVKELVKADYDSDPAQVKALFLLGRVPVPLSGDAAPDGHPDLHSGAWPADTFYGDMDGVWTDTTVSNATSIYPHNYNVPGDGKYDQSEIPGKVQLQIGRVDLSNMPGIETNGVATFPSETELLRRYLNKDHNYRHKITSLPQRGLIYNQTGDRGGEAFAADAWRNWAALLGPGSATSVGLAEFLPILSTNGYQWCYATSGGGPAEMGGLGGSRPQYYWKSGTTLDIVEMDIRTSFAMLLGSSFGDWDLQDNLMRAVLATPTHGLACVYAGRPHWFFHPMGLGETLGCCARLTQNNHAGGLYQNQSNFFAGFVHIALLGDPTLRQHVVAPPADLKLSWTSNTVDLSWVPSPELVAGYHVYRASSFSGPFNRITDAFLQTTNFTDQTAPATNWAYMVRAIKLEESSSGSYYNLSQGAIAQLNAHPLLSAFDSGTNMVLSWSGTPGVLYRILVSDSLPGTNWNPINPDLLATDSSIICMVSQSVIVPGNGCVATNSTPPPAPWIEDTLPAGAILGSHSDPWMWISNSPAPFSGSLAFQSDLGDGLHHQYFTSSTEPLSVGSNDVLSVEVFLDPENPPKEIMLQWNDGLSWEHRAFWGKDRITIGEVGTPGRFYKGPLPPAGIWTNLKVSASEVGLAGASVTGMGFMAYDGCASWDKFIKFSLPLETSGEPAVSQTDTPVQRFYKVLVIR